MKMELTETGYDSKFYDDDGRELKHLGVRSVTVECEVDQPTRAIMELVMVGPVTFTPAEVKYSIAGHNNVRGLILSDNTVEWLPGTREGRTVFPGVAQAEPEIMITRAAVDLPDWREELSKLVKVFDFYGNATDRDQRAAWKHAMNLLVAHRSLNTDMAHKESPGMAGAYHAPVNTSEKL